MDKRGKPDALSVQVALNQIRSVEFMSDSLSDGRTLQTFNVVDEYNRKDFTNDMDLSMSSACVICSLELFIK